MYENKISQNEDISIVNKEYTLNYNPVLKEEHPVHISNLIQETEEIMNQYGFSYKTTSYHMDYSIYFPWEDSTQKVFIKYKDGVCTVNFYTDSLCHISDREFITRYIYSILDMNTEQQEIAVSLFVEEIASLVFFHEKSLQVESFSYNALVEKYGACVSPKQAVVAECLLKDPESFSSIYNALGRADDLNEINIEMLETSEEYKNILRRIVE